MDLKVYTWTGDGHYLGATVIVSAKNKTEAEELIKKELSNIGLPDSWDQDSTIKKIKLDKPKLIWSDNGEY